ncbi:MAG: Hsp70 family protein, partial [Candidatus Spyradocola sp.]
MPPIIGIDFGNINSFPAYISGIDEKTNRGGTEVSLLPARRSMMGISTSFHYKKGTATYGDAAAIAVPKANRRNLLKRRMGTTEVIDGDTIRYDDVITAMIKHIVDTANEEMERNYHTRTNQISLAYPVVFSLAEKEHLRSLAERAVLANGEKVKVVGMIQEPACAALAYLSTLPVTHQEKTYTVLVYDLGGGTFDASVVTARQNAEGAMVSYEVLDQSGCPRAGNEFTEAMMNLITDKLDRLGADTPSSDAARERLRREAEELKINLSAADTTVVYYEDPEGNEIEIQRADLERVTGDLIDETLNVTKALYDRCPQKPEMIIMTGGQSQMPLIRTRLKQTFSSIGADNIIFHKPQQAIAFGAARFGRLNPVSVKLRTGRMLGLANVVGEDKDTRYVKELIPRNTTIPMNAPVSERFTPMSPTILFTIYLYEALTDTPNIYNEDDFKEVVSLQIDFNVDTPQKPEFEVSIYIDEANSIHFTAKDPKGKFKTVTTT